MTLRAIALVVAALFLACGGYTARLEAARVGVEVGDLDAALNAIDALVLRAEGGRRPHANDLPLLLLERAAIHQALGDHRSATDDLTAADPMLEVLDLSPDGIGTAATYLFSESKSLYRPPIYEKLMVNMMAIASFLAADNFSAARVEARRILVLTTYFEGTELANHPMLASAYAMAGLAMEMSGERATAARFYIQALEIQPDPTIAQGLLRTAPGTTMARHGAVGLARELLGLREGQELAVPEREAIVIVFSGRAPFRVAERFPIGPLIALIRMDTAYALTGEQQARMNRAIAGDLLTWVNFPSLVVHPSRYGGFSVSAGGRTHVATPLAELSEFALAQWERDRPGIAFAAITRALVRIGAREAIQATGRATDQGGGVGRTVGFIASLATQGALQAADTPDTRTWTFMPGQLSIIRVPVDAGPQPLHISPRGAAGPGATTQRAVVDVPAGERRVVTVRFF